MTSDAPTGHPSPHRRRTNPAALLACLATGPGAWAAQLILDYGLSSYACFPHETPWLQSPPPGWGGETALLVGVNLACLLVALVSAALCVVHLRRVAHEAGGGAESLIQIGEGRSRFMALCGLMANVGFALAILFNTIEPLMVSSCWSMAR